MDRTSLHSPTPLVLILILGWDVLLRPNAIDIMHFSFCKFAAAGPLIIRYEGFVMRDSL